MNHRKSGNESERNTRNSTKKLGTPEEVAELVTFLLTSKEEYINGEVIRIDGGFTNTK
jgi:NAD(P)-dependent dehydrogenase (short-subunit alcohol dehydrogenase family)